MTASASGLLCCRGATPCQTSSFTVVQCRNAPKVPHGVGTGVGDIFYVTLLTKSVFRHARLLSRGATWQGCSLPLHGTRRCSPTTVSTCPCSINRSRWILVWRRARTAVPVVRVLCVAAHAHVTPRVIVIIANVVVVIVVVPIVVVIVVVIICVSFAAAGQAVGAGARASTCTARAVGAKHGMLRELAE